MKFLNLKIQNFLTVGNAELDLDDRGLLLIQGENGDDSSASSNGAGKSSIVDALCWALYGVTARGVSGDAVVNRTAKKDCVVSITVEDGADKYRISRHRKDKVNKNALLVQKINGAVDLTKGTDKETQEVVTAIVGSSYEVFASSVYAGQERMPDLPAMTDKYLKMLIEEAAGVQLLEKAHTVAKKRLSESKEAMTLALNSTAKNKHEVEIVKNQIEQVKSRIVEFDKTKRDRAKAKLEFVLVEQKKIAEIETRKTTANPELIEFEIEKTQKLINEGELKNKVYLESRLLSDKAKNALALANNDIKHKKDTISGYVREIQSINEIVGKPCKECGKEICAHDVESAKQTKLKTAKQLKSELEDLQAKANEIEKESEQLTVKTSKLSSELVDISSLQSQLLSLNKSKTALDGMDDQIASHNRMIDSIKKMASDILKESNPFRADLVKLEVKLAQLLEEQSELELKEIKASENLEMVNHAVGVFGTAGVRAHILDTVTPYLNDRTREYLGALADGNIHATWTTLTKTSKGELREKFSIAVTNDKGAESFAGLSGGEKRKVRLATCMALQDLVASRATKPIQLFVGDEIDDALDAPGLERLMGVLEVKARERGTVLVISHNELRDFIDLAIEVKKSEGFSIVSGDNLKGDFA